MLAGSGMITVIEEVVWSYGVPVRRTLFQEHEVAPLELIAV